MDRKLTRTILLISMTTISIFIGGIFAFKAMAPSFLVPYASISNLDNNRINETIYQNYSKRGFLNIDQDACCGHTDTTPPTIQLYSHNNGDTILGGTAIKIFIDDDNPFYDNKASEVLCSWDDETSNTTLAETEENYIYETVPPLVVGTHVLNIYADDGSGNWASAVFTLTVIIQPTTTETTTQPTTTETTTQPTTTETTNQPTTTETTNQPTTTETTNQPIKTNQLKNSYQVLLANQQPLLLLSHLRSLQIFHYYQSLLRSSVQ